MIDFHLKKCVNDTKYTKLGKLVTRKNLKIIFFKLF